MTTLTSTPATTSLARPVPVAAGVTAIGLAIYQVATPGSPAAEYGSVLDWVRELLFLGYLVGAVATVLASRRAGLCSRAASRLIGVGYGAIAAGVAAGMALREDPDWFFVLGGPGNLLAIGGFVTWAVWGQRRRVLPLFAALLCGVGGTVAVLFAEFGTSVLIGAFFLWLAFRDDDQGTVSTSRR
jgi:hypothetical protein